MKLRNVNRQHVSYVELERDGKTPLGISVKDGAKYGFRPLIKNIKSQSLSHRSHCVAVGDVILSICGEDSKGMSRKEVRRRLKEVGSCIELKLEYEVREACFDNFGIYRYERMSLKIKKESGSFGFILRKNFSADSASTAEFPIITNIRPGGPADKEKKLRDGDRLLKIDDQNLSWLSLLEVSDILRKKEEATFLFEYNSGIVDFYFKVGEKTEIEIDCPDADLGMVLGSSSSEDSKIIVREIRQGSLAHRCGAFREGDAVLLINDIDTALLTVSKANSLLQRFRKEPGKLVFIPHMKGEKPHERLGSKSNITKMGKEKILSPHTSLNISHSQKPIERHSKLKKQAAINNERNRNSLSPSTSSTNSYQHQFQATNHQVFNSPCSIHRTVFVPGNVSHNHQSDLEVQELQTKTISMFRDIVQNISNIQHFISYFDNEVARIAEKDVDTSENHNGRRQGISNIDVDKFSQLKAIFSQMKNSASAFTMHLVKNFKMFPSRNLSSLTDNQSNGDSRSISTFNIIHQIVGDLTEIHLKQFVNKKLVDEFSARLDAVELDCWECHKSCFSAFFLTQKVLLLLSFSDPDVSMRFVIQMLMQNLMNVKIPCDDCKRPWCSVSQTVEEIQRNIPVEPENSLNRSSRESRNIQDHTKTVYMKGPVNSQRKCCRNIAEPSVGLDLKTDNAFFRLGQNPTELSKSQITSDSESNRSNTFETIPESIRASRPITKNHGSTRQRIETEDDCCDWKNYCNSARTKVHSEKNMVQIPMQTWKSNEAISTNRCEFETHTLTRANSVLPNHLSTFEENWPTPTDLQFRNSPLHLSLASDEENGLTEDDSPSVVTIQPTEPIHANGNIIPKIERETTLIRLRNEGGGFGLNFEFNALSDGTPTVPVITAVRQRSAAHKCGIILEGDRLLEINGRSLVGLASPKIHAILLEAFAANEALLKVEFDVVVQKVQFGTFDVRIDKTIKPGLEFKEFQKGAPLVVKGVVKGSAAHRSGRLFPGDEILYTNCTRQESYESCACTYKRKETVILTVRREPSKDPPEEELETGTELDSISLHPKTSSPNDCILYRKMVRTVNDTDTRYLDHEFTLFRDPEQNDFGFLVGQDLISGKVYVTGMRPGGPADRSKAIKKNDRILEVRNQKVLKTVVSNPLDVSHKGSKGTHLTLGKCMSLGAKNATRTKNLGPDSLPDFFLRRSWV